MRLLCFGDDCFDSVDVSAIESAGDDVMEHGSQHIQRGTLKHFNHDTSVVVSELYPFQAKSESI